MKKTFILSLFTLTVFCFTNVRAQYALPTFGIYLTSPTAFFYKAGAKVELRVYSENAFLLGYTQYYGYFPGYQADFEYRVYFPSRSFTPSKIVTENLVYGKIGNGYADYKPSSLFSSGKDDNKAPGTYYFIGGGVGKHFDIGVFFMEIAAGVKFSYIPKPPAQYNERLFYAAGPGSIPDVHFRIGLQF